MDCLDCSLKGSLGNPKYFSYFALLQKDHFGIIILRLYECVVGMNELKGSYDAISSFHFSWSVTS